MKQTEVIDLNEMTLMEIRDYIVDLHNIIGESKYGISLHPKDNEFLETVFEDNTAYALASAVDNSRREIFEFANMRYCASISGAMRWPFSQEAAIAFNPSTGHHEFL
jgi:hypothetical protein